MDKAQRQALADKGMEILRPMLDQRFGRWTISRYSKNGGWSKGIAGKGRQYYATFDLASADIDEIVAANPKKYIHDK